jgi:hypothetical protein
MAAIAIVFLLYPFIRVSGAYIKGKLHRFRAMQTIRQNHIVKGGKRTLKFLSENKNNNNLNVILYAKFIELLKNALRTYLDNFFNLWKGKYYRLYSYWENILQFLSKYNTKVAHFVFFKNLAATILNPLIKLYESVKDKTSFVIVLAIILVIGGDSWFLQLWIREANFVHLVNQTSKFWTEILLGFFLTSIMSLMISAWFIMLQKVIPDKNKKSEPRSKTSVIIFSFLSGLMFICTVCVIYLRAIIPSENPITNWFWALLWGVATIGIGFIVSLLHQKILDGLKAIVITIIIIITFPFCTFLYFLHLLKIVPLAFLFPLIRGSIFLANMALKKTVSSFTSYASGLGPEASLSEELQQEYDDMTQRTFNL